MRSFLDRLPRAWFLAVGVILLGALVGGLYGLVGPKDYRATAQVLITPLPASDTTFTGMDLFRDTGTRRGSAATAAALLQSPQIADAVNGQLGLKVSRDALLGQVQAHAVGNSNVVDVSVTDSNPGRAAQIANAFVSVLVSQRTASFLGQLAGAIQRDQQVLAALPPARRSGPEGAEIARRLAVLHSFESQPDPTLRQAVQAAPPTTPSGMGAGPVAAIGAGVGALVGVLLLLALFVRDEMRRRAAYAGPHYERRTFEQMAERLEGRVHERLDALAAEEERLAQREQEIGTRERRVEARLEELRVAQESGLGGSDAHERQLAEREDELDRRDQEVSTRHRELAAGLAELARARVAADERLDALIAEEKRLAEVEQALKAREQEKLVTLQELRSAQAPQDDARERALALREEELAARERALEATRAEGEWGEQELAAIAARETALSHREAELVKAHQELADQEARLAERERLLAEEQARPVVQIPMAPPPPPQPTAAFEPLAPLGDLVAVETPGRWNLSRLEQLVADYGDEFPARVEEWRSYLYFLKDHADAAGNLPSRFDWLVEDTFRELLENVA
ncbi:MAG TPA: Wzz/FepE/Etk N-terminal domain-containing protein [Gaiellaceae bacterium]|nr:Wzz/FepE/Etk N-terminal domain-containing protein [Gaiellaceae bacterium]